MTTGRPTLREWADRQTPVRSFTGGLASAHLQPAPHALLLLQFLGRYETVMFYWPSLLCLAFLLGRFLHMFVKSLRVHLGWELPMVSTEGEPRVCPRRSSRHNRPVRQALVLLLHSTGGNADPAGRPGTAVKASRT